MAGGSLSDPREGRATAILRAIHATGGAATRAEVMAHTGMPRGAVSVSVDRLTTAGWLATGDEAPSTGGRRPRLLQINAQAGSVGIIDIGGSRTRIGVVDLSGNLLGDDVLTIDVAAGPRDVLGWAVPRLAAMLNDIAPGGRRHIVCGLPGPVDTSTGRTVSPPIMAGWEGFDTSTYLRGHFGAPVTIDNDVNMLTVAEHRLSYPHSSVLLVVKLGTGIGGGIVIDGRLLRGARGAAGDIGHIQATPQTTSLCRCGQVGCVESEAGGWALVEQLCAQGLPVSTVSDVADLAREGAPEAVSAVRGAARTIGLAIADAVSLLNPDTVVLVGEILGAGEHVLSIIREAVYQRSLPLATHNLVLEQSMLGPLVGLLGGGMIGIDALIAAATEEIEEESTA
jgi:predicted NBD/HSP70 family sugar kinase